MLGAIVINPWGVDFGPSPVVPFLPQMGGPLIALAATWLLTRRELLSPRAQGRSLRLAARVSAVACILVFPVIGGLLAAGSVRWVISAWSIVIPVVLNAVAAAAVLVYLAGVAGRAERLELYRACRAAAWALPPLLLLQVLPPVQYLHAETAGGSVGYGLLPVHAVGHAGAVVPLAWAVIAGEHVGLGHAAWAGMTAASLFAAGVLLAAGLVFRRIAAGSGGNSAASSHP